MMRIIQWSLAAFAVLAIIVLIAGLFMGVTGIGLPLKAAMIMVCFAIGYVGALLVLLGIVNVLRQNASARKLTQQ